MLKRNWSHRSLDRALPVFSSYCQLSRGRSSHHVNGCRRLDECAKVYFEARAINASCRVIEEAVLARVDPEQIV